MKFIYVLEDDERLQRDLFETFKLIDPKLHIRFFNGLEPFHQFLKEALQGGPTALLKHGTRIDIDTSPDSESSPPELRLIVAKYELFGPRNMNLIERAHQFLQRKKISSAEGALILTAFDSPDFDIKLAEDRIINNVIFKPFDKLILKQHLQYALTGHHPLKSEDIASMQLKSTIEMLKEAELSTLSEVGFSTINNHEIRVGALTKYYAEPFQTDEKKSVFAYCHSCRQIGLKEYLCQFLYFAIDNKQIQSVRKHILQNKQHQAKPLLHTSQTPLKIVLLSEDTGRLQELKTFLTDKMKSLEVFSYSSFGQLLSDLGDKDSVHKQNLPAHIDLVFGDHDIFYAEKGKKWEQLLQGFKDRRKKHGSSVTEDTALYLITKHKLTPDEIKAFSSWAKEIFFLPLDRNYLLRRLLSGETRFTNQEEISVSSLDEKVILKVANPVEITEISEAGLILKYYREIGIGSFREFILWRPQELETPEIIATVNYTEKDKGGETFLNHFVFFGMTDHFLKHIRLWLREAYIKTKDTQN